MRACNVCVCVRAHISLPYRTPKVTLHHWTISFATKLISLVSSARPQALTTTIADLRSLSTSFSTFPVRSGHSIQSRDAISPIVAGQPVATGQPCTPTQRESVARGGRAPGMWVSQETSANAGSDTV